LEELFEEDKVTNKIEGIEGPNRKFFLQERQNYSKEKFRAEESRRGEPRYLDGREIQVKPRMQKM
jgi:hypothetical protein